MGSTTRRTGPRAGAIALTLAVAAALVPIAGAAAAPTAIAFGTQPAGPAGGGSPFPTQPVVHVEDAGGPLAGQSVTLAIKPGTGSVGATLTCADGLARTTGAAGDAAFVGCSIDRRGNGYVLVARAGSLSAESAPFSVVPGPAHHLVFASYPSAASSTVFRPQPGIGVVDAGGNFAIDYRPVTLGIDRNAPTFSCTGGLTQPVFQGLIVFQGCQQTAIGVGYRLTADDGPGGLPAITGPAFDVTNAAAAKLLLCWGPTEPCRTTPPSGLTGGIAFPVQPALRVTDAQGFTVVRDNSTVVTLGVSPGTPDSGGPGGLRCRDGLTQTAINGAVHFNGCALDHAGVGYRLRGTAAGLTAATSNPFTVHAGAPVRLGFLSAPTVAVVNAPFTVTAAIQDAGGNTVASGISGVLTLSLGNNPGATSFRCDALSVPAVNGVATYTNCSINQRAGGFTLIASASSLTPALTLPSVESAPFRVVDAAAALLLTASASAISWGETALLSVHFFEKGGLRPVSVESSTDRTTWSVVASGRTDSSGQATVPIRPDRNAWYRVRFAGANDLPEGTSNVVRVVVRQIALLRPTAQGRITGVTIGRTVRLTTTVRPARPDLPRALVRYVVYRLSGNAWRLAASHDIAIDAAGRATIEIQFATVGRWYVRSMALPTAANANSPWSPVEWFDVAPLAAR